MFILALFPFRHLRKIRDLLNTETKRLRPDFIKDDIDLISDGGPYNENTFEAFKLLQSEILFHHCSATRSCAFPCQLFVLISNLCSTS